MFLSRFTDTKNKVTEASSAPYYFILMMSQILPFIRFSSGSYLFLCKEKMQLRQIDCSIVLTQTKNTIHYQKVQKLPAENSLPQKFVFNSKGP